MKIIKRKSGRKQRVRISKKVGKFKAGRKTFVHKNHPRMKKVRI